MKAKNILSVSIAAGACTLMYACGGGSGSSSSTTSSMTPPPPASTAMNYNMTGLEAVAKFKSESTDPFAVDGGAATLSPDNDETSDPLPIDQ